MKRRVLRTCLHDASFSGAALHTHCTCHDLGVQTYTTPARFAAGETVTHTYSSGYRRRALVWASDRRGGVAASFVDFFGYVNAAPTLTHITATPVDGDQRRVKFDSDAEDFDLCTFRWSFGDGEESRAVA